MKPFIFLPLFVLSFLLLPAPKAWANASLLGSHEEYVTMGASVGYSFFGKNPQFFFGVHTAYWVAGQAGHLHGAKLGIEFREAKNPYFTVGAQTGVGLAGITADVIYHPDEGLGTQVGVWANMFLGTNLRVRYMDELTFDPNVYVTLPVLSKDATFE